MRKRPDNFSDTNVLRMTRAALKASDIKESSLRLTETLARRTKEPMRKRLREAYIRGAVYGALLVAMREGGE